MMRTYDYHVRCYGSLTSASKRFGHDWATEKAQRPQWFAIIHAPPIEQPCKANCPYVLDTKSKTCDNVSRPNNQTDLSEDLADSSLFFIHDDLWYGLVNQYPVYTAARHRAPHATKNTLSKDHYKSPNLDILRSSLGSRVAFWIRFIASVTPRGSSLSSLQVSVVRSGLLKKILRNSQRCSLLCFRS